MIPSPKMRSCLPSFLHPFSSIPPILWLPGCDVRPHTRDKLQAVADSAASIVAGKEYDLVALL
jgi:hypothetical protein